MAVFNTAIVLPLVLLLGTLSIQADCVTLTHNPEVSKANLSVVAIKSGSSNNKTVELNWTNPSDPGSRVIANTIYCWTKDGQKKEAQCKPANATRHQVTDLLPWTAYTFQLKSCFETIRTAEKDNSEKCVQSNQVEYKTEMGSMRMDTINSEKVETPSEVLNFKVSYVNATSITLVWEKPKFPNGPISGYSLFQLEAEHRELDGNQTRIQLFNLSPYTPFVFRISAFNLDPSETPHRMKKEGPPNTLTIETKRGSPTECLNFKVESTTKPGVSVQVQWGRPNTPNGPINGYLLHYSVVNNRSETIKTLELPPTSFYQLIEDLDAYTLYLFEVQAYNIANDGSPGIVRGKISGVTYLTQVYSASEPQDVKFVGTTSKSLTIAWSKPVHPRGPIDAYYIKYGIEKPIDENEKNDKNRYRTVRTSSTSYTLENLTAWREYFIAIWAINVYTPTNFEFQGRSVAVYGYTHIGVPMKPLNVVIEKKGPQAINLSWNISTPKTGPTMYMVHLDEKPVNSWNSCTDSDYWKSKARTALIEGWNSTKFTFEDLKPKHCYRARVVSQTEAGFTFSDYSKTIPLV